jgi:hypothetical protein
MNQQIQDEEERHLAMHLEKDADFGGQLAQWGFSPEEIVSLFWLRHWYQTGGSDRMELLRHWEFLKRLVKVGRIEV